MDSDGGVCKHQASQLLHVLCWSRELGDTLDYRMQVGCLTTNYTET